MLIPWARELVEVCSVQITLQPFLLRSVRLLDKTLEHERAVGAAEAE